MLRYLNPLTYKIGYMGWTGRSNLGDEALYQIIRSLLTPVDLVQYKMFYHRGKILERLQETLLSGFMMGAGTLINSRGLLPLMNHFNAKHIPTFVFGAGVLDPEFYGQFKGYPNEMSKWVDTLSVCNSVSLRGPLSAQVLKNYGYSSTRVIGDPVLSFAKDKIPSASQHRLIGINFGVTRNGSCLYGGSDKQVEAFVVQLANVLISKGYYIRFFPVWNKDVDTIRSAASKVKGRVDVWSHSPNIINYFKALDNVRIFIGEKLHSVIGALCLYIPSLMLAYQPKCIDFMSSLGLDAFTLRTDRLDISEALEKIKFIEDHYEQYQANVFQHISRWKNIQRQTAQEIIQLVTS